MSAEDQSIMKDAEEMRLFWDMLKDEYGDVQIPDNRTLRGIALRAAADLIVAISKEQTDILKVNAATAKAKREAGDDSDHVFTTAFGVKCNLDKDTVTTELKYSFTRSLKQGHNLSEINQPTLF